MDLLSHDMHLEASAFLIASPKSNSGKTIITLGLIETFKKRGKSIQPFKCGPDYIDTMHHSTLAEKSSYNLDLWMSSPDHVQEIFNSKGLIADISIIEGAMGLFDGATKDKGSAAAIAKLLNTPVVLIVDASSMAYSVAPLLFGFKNFDTDLRLAGVIFNKVSGVSHYHYLQQAAADVGLTSFGYLPRDERLIVGSRHLGLTLPDHSDSNEAISIASELIEKHIDIEALLSSTTYHFSTQKDKKTGTKGQLIFAIARDKAFNFIYQENVNRLKELGAVCYFSPLTDKNIPKCDLIWLPGGYPELFLEELSSNREMAQSILDFAENGGAIIAECGGMMYLGESITNKEGVSYPMVSLFSYKSSFKEMKLHLGYRKLEFQNDTYYGHEFHYSTVASSRNDEQGVAKIETARNTACNTSIFRKSHVWSSYIHLYLGESDKMKRFITALMK